MYGEKKQICDREEKRQICVDKMGNYTRPDTVMRKKWKVYKITFIYI